MKNFIEVLDSNNRRQLINVNSILYVRETADGQTVIALPPLDGDSKNVKTIRKSFDEIYNLIEDAQI